MKKLLLILLVFIHPFLSYGEIVIRNIYQNNDTINFGMCRIGNELGTEFEIQNLTDENYKLLDIDPSFYLGTPRDITTNHYEEFTLRGLSLPVSIPAHTTLSINIAYGARPEVSIYPVGMKTALLKIGIVSDTLQNAPATSDLVVYKEFILKAKKTSANLDFYENYINLDTVCVNPYNPVDFQTYLQSNTPDAVRILQEGFFERTDSCFESELYRTDVDFTSDFSSLLQQKTRAFRYSPINSGWDTASYLVEYEVDSYTDTTSLMVTAFAALQKIDLSEAIGYSINADTIDVGDLRIGDSVAIPVILKNSGNINFGTLSQKILDIESESLEPAFEISGELLPDNRHSLPGETDTMTITFKPDRQGTILARCVIDSDISARKIKNVNNASRKVVFYLKASGVASRLLVSADTLDFGNVVISEECPVVLDSFVTLYNSGNRTLKVTQTEILPSSGIPYVFDNSEFTIDAGKSVRFNVSFLSDGLPSGTEYSGKILFHSNSIDEQTTELYVYANTVPSQYMNVCLPNNISAKTGRLISIPVFVESGKISTANTFSCRLDYDKTILQYNDFTSYGTASGNAWQILVSDINEHSVSLEIQNDNDVEFAASDTMILLNFHTFLSQNYYTPILIADVKIGNSTCEQIFKYDLTNASSIFTIDSVCGLDYKTLPESGEGTFAVTSIYPNPCRDFVDIQFENPYACNLKLEIINAIGISEQVLFEGSAEKGLHNLSFDTGKLVPGSYHCRLTAGNIIRYGHFKVLK